MAKGINIDVVARKDGIDALVRIAGPEFTIIGNDAAKITDDELLALARGEKLEGWTIDNRS